ncbi:PIG-L family deacetylase [Gammaproteobacteria bacterium]|nr:PIG-L family deacetylase [Gammaproteobacteria bacterium]
MPEKKILVIAAHPDDETIGCGGSLCRHASENDEIAVITLTNGVGSRNESNESDLSSREISAKKAIDILGAHWIAKGDFPDNAMDSAPLLEIVKFIEATKEKFDPDIIYSHSPSDLNVDHKVSTAATLTAFRPQPGEKNSEIRLFEIPSATDYTIEELDGSFNPNLFINIEEFWNSKLDALKCYESEMREYPHSRSYKKIRSLAEHRGSQSGLKLAEAFMLVRKIHR